MLATKTIKVLIVDDSAIVRKILSRTFAQDKEIEVVGTAPDPYIARDKIVAYDPDVLTLDVEMPRMDGITFLRKLMRHRPMPVIVLSSVTPKGGTTAMEAIEAGAVDVISKPGGPYTVEQACDELLYKIKSAARANMTRAMENLTLVPPKTKARAMSKTTNKVFAIGASTGGVQALTAVLTRLPANAPGTIVVQHMPANFTKSFAARLNSICDVNIKEAQEGDSVIPGRVLIAPGGRHMVLKRSGSKYYVSIQDGDAVCRQKPSVEVAFNSVAEVAGSNAVGVILTGMGSDGSGGLLNMRRAGANTIAEDESSCVVFGMPKEAIKKGGAEKILPLEMIAEQMIEFADVS